MFWWLKAVVNVEHMLSDRSINLYYISHNNRLSVNIVGSRSLLAITTQGPTQISCQSSYSGLFFGIASTKPNMYLTLTFGAYGSKTETIEWQKKTY